MVDADGAVEVARDGARHARLGRVGVFGWRAGEARRLLRGSAPGENRPFAPLRRGEAVGELVDQRVAEAPQRLGIVELREVVPRILTGHPPWLSPPSGKVGQSLR